MKSKLAVLAALVLTPAFAFADFTGDAITGQIVGGPGAFQIANPNAIVGPGVEFVVDFVGTPSHQVDISGVSMKVSAVFPGRISTGAGEVLVISDLDAIGGGVIVGITNFQTNEPEYSINSVTFSDNEVRFAMSPNIWEIGGFASWDVVLSGPSVNLSVTGNCPGVMTFTATGATPGGIVAFAYGFGTSTTIPNTFPCAGTQLDVGNPNFGYRTVRADAAGNAVLTATVPASACRRVNVQALDVDSCVKSGVVNP